MEPKKKTRAGVQRSSLILVLICAGGWSLAGCSPTEAGSGAGGSSATGGSGAGGGGRGGSSGGTGGSNSGTGGGVTGGAGANIGTGGSTAGAGGSGTGGTAGTGATGGSGGTADGGGMEVAAGGSTGGAADGGTGDLPSTTPPGGGAGRGEPPESPTPGTTDLTTFKFSKVIRMDTTAAGAGVMNSVANFPVAVLLNATNFDFTQAKAAGEDVRFATMDGKPLPYSIEHWDGAAKKAALWVRVDVVGNNGTQAIVMHFGNPDASSAASTKAVFSKEAGFLGVYHLNQDGNTTADGYRDASANEVHGTGVRMAAGSAVDGRIGLGTKFNNAAGGGMNVQWVKVDGPKVAQDFNGDAHPITATIWTNAESWRGYYETIFSKGDRSWTLQRDYQGRMEACQYVGYHACAITAAPVTNQWVHWMLMQKRGTLTIWRNGVRVAGTGGTAQYGAHAFGIGNQTQYNMGADWKRGFHGLLDEARVMSVEKNIDWAKLDFESQKEGSKFLVFGATQMR
jgi:Domain of unknown function (DUF2341)/Concanavalin A-like lectin/glucanases superfamily